MAAALGPLLGINAKVYRNTGTYGSPTWTAISLVRDVQDASTFQEADASSRATKAVLTKKTMTQIQHDLVVRADASDAGYQALWDASQDGTVIDVLILDNAITVEGSLGYRYHAEVFKTGQNQDASGVIYTNFTLKPGYSSDGVPSKIEMAASSVLTPTAF